MTWKTKNTLYVGLLALTLIGLLIYSTTRPQQIPRTTFDRCLEAAEIWKEGTKGTEFENWNWYHSCVYNATCTSPVNTCPLEEIHEKTKDWK